MPEAKTLRQLSGRTVPPAKVSEAALILIDCQNTYRKGPLTLAGIEPALDEAKRLLERFRAVKRPVIHIAHDSGHGSLFDRKGENGQIADKVAPAQGEALIVKGLPNAFAKTDLDETLKALGAKNLVVAGFMTHMCVNSTVRAASELGYRSTVVGKATATRALPGPGGRPVAPESLQAGSLAALADLFATVVDDSADLPD